MGGRRASAAFPALRLSLLSFTAGTVLAELTIFYLIYSEIRGDTDSSSFTSASGRRNSLVEPMTLFENILSDLDARYVDSVDTRKLFETGVAAMLRSLDPYTEFENRQDAKSMGEMVSGKYAGVGLVIAERPINTGKLDLKEETLRSLGAEAEELSAQGVNGGRIEMDVEAARSYLEEDEAKPKPGAKKIAAAPPKKPETEIRVVSAFEGYAFDAGMRPGDRILAVDGVSVKDTKSDDVRDLLRGKPGTTARISVMRDGVEGTNEIPVPRRIIKIPDVKLTTFLGEEQDGVGYIQLSAFTESSGAEMRRSILTLQRIAEKADPTATGLKGLVLDLRGNPGGLLTSAVDVTSLLVPNGSDIVSARGRGFPGILYRSRTEPLLDASTRLVVLVNGNTASAAEIVSGAVQDLDVGVIMGSDRTYGKGLVQNVEELPFDTALKFTVAKYYTPSGRCIQSTNYKEGAGPDAKFVATKVDEKDKTEFFTRGGRLVRDGGGVEADVKVASPKASALEVTLMRSDMFNRFASEWSKKNVMGQNFAVNDGMYQEFRKFVEDRQRGGQIKLESLYLGPLEVLKKELKTSGYLASRNELESLQGKLVKEMERDFDGYKKDIKEDISTAILSRYLPESMLLDRSLATDVQATAAYKLIRDPGRFDKVLVRTATDGKGKAGARGRAATTASAGKNGGDKAAARAGRPIGLNVGEGDGLPRLNVNF